MAEGTRVCYKDAPGQGLTVRLIRIWHRGEITPVMSASSGPKAYIKNGVFYLFEANPAIDAVLMVRASGDPFVLFRVGRSYFDVTHREVVIESAEVLCSNSA